MKPVFRTYELAKKLDCSERTIRRMIDRGELPGFKVGGTWRIKNQEYEQILQNRHTKSDKSDKSDT